MKNITDFGIIRYPQFLKPKSSCPGPSPRRLPLCQLTVAVAVGLLALAPVCFASATNIYIAQNAAGAANGTDCADAFAVNFFNSSGNWGSGPNQIGAGTTVHLCGTFTGAAGSTMLTFNGSGSSGSPITLLFESGAVLTAPYWAGNPNGAVALGSHSWIVVDGGTNGQLNATANGTNLANHNATYGLTTAGGSNLTFKNLNIINLYQRVAGGHELADGSTVRAIAISGGSNITITNNTIHDVGWAITADSNTDNLFVGPGNNIYNADHDVAPSSLHWYVFGNHFHDWAVWDSDNDQYHHDGVHCFSGSNGNTLAGYVYNNQFDGATGGNMNQFVFLEGNTSSTKCMVSGGNANIFNNVMIGNGGFPAMAAFYGNSVGGDINDVFANNTMLNSVPGSSFTCMNFQNAINTRVENNAVGGCGVLIGGGGVLASVFTAIDYNFYQNCTSFNCFDMMGIDSGSFATWQAGNCTGVVNTCDPHGAANLGSTSYFNLTAGCTPGSVGASCKPLSGSPLIGAGTNLSSVCTGQANPGLGALCSDMNGNSRPSTGAWDLGAIQFAASAPPPNPPTGLTANVN